MDGEDDWLVRAADRELANHDFDANSFEDSERFEGDSDGDSYGSLSEGLNWDWRDAVHNDLPISNYGIDRRGRSGRISVASNSTAATLQPSPIPKDTNDGFPRLVDMSAKICGQHLAFYQLESMYKCINMLKRSTFYPYLKKIKNLSASDIIPEIIFLAISRHCFPTSLQDIRLYSVMSSGKPENFNFGELLYSGNSVTHVYQIGYLITAMVTDDIYGNARVVPTGPGNIPIYNVAIKADRGRIIYSKCSCDDPSEWCRHICALILFRFKRSDEVKYRWTIWDSINALEEKNTKKFAQYLINDLAIENLPLAQSILDSIADPNSAINISCGAPDPTDGGHDPIAVMNFNQNTLHEMVRRQLNCFCLKQAVAHGIDEMNLSKNTSAQEFQRHLQPLANLAPSAMNNYIMMVKSMLLRRDPNAITLIRILTEECIANRLILLHWYCAKLVQSGLWQMYPEKDDYQVRQLNISQLCDAMVGLWRWVALNPSGDKEYRDQLLITLQNYHKLAADRIFKIIRSVQTEESLVGSILANIHNQNGQSLSASNVRFTMNFFPGFHNAMKACVAMQDLNMGVHPLHSLTAWIEWQKTVDLLPEIQPTSPKKRSKKKNRRHGDRRNSRRGSRDHLRNNSRNRAARRRREESSESGQESEEDNGRRQQIPFPTEDVAAVLAESYTQMDPFETRFAQLEAVGAHGYTRPAVKMALKLMKSLQSHVDEAISVELCPASTSWQMINNNFEAIQLNTTHRIELLEKTTYIASILVRDRNRQIQSELFHFIIKVLLTNKVPMSSKYSQVKEHYLEMGLLKILETIDIHESEVELMRKCSDRIREITENDGIPPIGLAKFIFEELTYSTYVVKFDHLNQPYTRHSPARNGRVPEDDDIAFAAAANALGTRLPISDNDYPMLLESVRHLKSHLTITLLTSFKDDKEKLGIVLDRLLDPRFHQLYKKHFTNALFFLKDCHRRKIYNGQRPHYPYECRKKKEDQAMEENPIRQDDEEELEKLKSTTILAQLRQQEATRKPQNQQQNMAKNATKRFKARNVVNINEGYYNFMCDLGKKVLHFAGGNPTTMFAAVHPAAGTNKNLHICSLLISLYGLGIQNKGKKDSWRVRNYSSDVSWIQQQIPEIGAQAYDIIRDIYWEFHFTPSEMAMLSEKTIQTQHPHAPKEAALLSLAILPYAHVLSSQEIKAAIQKCKDIGWDELEKACDAVVQCHDSTGDISADILFQISHHYEDLYEEKDRNKTYQIRQNTIVCPPLHHMASYPGAHVAAPQLYMNPQYPKHIIAYQNHPTSSVYGQQQPVFPVNPMHVQQPGPSNAQGGLHQSHSAPQLSCSAGATASSKIFTPRLIRAYKAGVHALGAMMKASQDAPKNNYPKFLNSPYQHDVEWLCDLVIKNLGIELTIEFFEHAHLSITCPYTLVHIARKLYEINYQANFQHMPLPPKKLPPVNIVQPPTNFQPLLNMPPPRLSQIRHLLLNSCLEGRPFHPVTVDIMEKCYEQLLKAIQIRLSFASFGDHDRNEAECLLQAYFKDFAFMLPPQPQNILNQHFIVHVKKQKNWKNLGQRCWDMFMDNPQNISGYQMQQFSSSRVSNYNGSRPPSHLSAYNGNDHY